MLIGSYYTTLNDKRRVAVPKKFISELGNKVIIAKWYENCLVLVSFDFWDKLLKRLTGGKKTISLGVRDIERFVLGSAYEAEPDNQGRIVIPEALSKYAGLGKEIVFVGLGDRVEIWPKTLWEDKGKELVEETKEYIEKLAEKET